METAPSLETVYQAIHALYHNPDPAGKEKASSWLGELQRSVFAWRISDQLLHQKAELEACYFAAQTMRTKIQYSFHELPVESYSSLRDSLLEHLSHVTEETAHVIVTQLCLALADLALQMASWESPVEDIIGRLGNDAKYLPALLEVLTVLPEEVNSRSLRLGANRRTEVLKSLSHVEPQVLQLLNTCLHTLGVDNATVQTRVFRCFGSWLSLGVVPSSEEHLNSLLNVVFHALVNSNTPSPVHEAASDCICSALFLIEAVEKNYSLAHNLFHGVYKVVDAYHMSVAKEDIDKSMNYCRMFTELAESLLDVIILSPGQNLGDLRTLDLLLICVGHHDYEVAEITFNFWYRLSEILFKKNNDHLNRLFHPYIRRLIISLAQHSQMEPDHEGILEEHDDFGEFRSRVSDLIKDIVFIVGSSSCFKEMFENLKNQGSNATWNMSEASLFVMAAVAKNIIPDENEVVPQVVEAIIHLPEDSHIAVRHTSTLLLGELCEWIEKHPQYLELVLNYILSCLQHKPLARMAASALQNICSSCRTKMASHFNGLLQIIQAIDSFSISNEAAVDLLKGAALILCQLPDEQVTDGLRVLCQCQLSHLSKVLQQDPQDKTAKFDPTPWLDRISAIFRHVNICVKGNNTHPCLVVVKEVWPVMSQVCEYYKADIRIIERCCRCIRFLIRCVGRYFAILVEPLVTQIVRIYQEHPHSCFLYLGSILVDEYGRDPGCVQGLVDMLQAFCGPTFHLLDKQDGLRNHPDTVDDLFRLCTRFLQTMPVVFLQCPVFKSLFQLALAACNLDHKDANSSVMQFFYSLMQIGRLHEKAPDFTVRQSLVKGILKEHRQTLIFTLVQAAIFHLPSYVMPDIADVLYEMMKLDKELFLLGFEEALQQIPTQNQNGSVTVTPDQLKEFHCLVSSAEHVKTISTSLRDFSRLYK
ncbi:transportin-3-like [Limulus polyphemus]|uniref:Transportin-3-like n=1 Tax=Limulus polyphemus TaxID=6850 RepID=A0ABM1B9K1_LIMPO|nr:transportin-3-like [Limulus polyphemus]